jgi:hypothetical protein
MKSTVFLIGLSLSFAHPAQAQSSEENAPSMMERGLELFLEGLREEMAPTLDDLQGLTDEMEPAFRQFMDGMGPLMADLFDKIDDINRYELPEVLENGDIIIRRKPEPLPDDEQDQNGETDIEI